MGKLKQRIWADKVEACYRELTSIVGEIVGVGVHPAPWVELKTDGHETAKYTLGDPNASASKTKLMATSLGRHLGECVCLTGEATRHVLTGKIKGFNACKYELLEDPKGLREAIAKLRGNHGDIIDGVDLDAYFEQSRECDQEEIASIKRLLARVPEWDLLNRRSIEGLLSQRKAELARLKEEE